jgi:hypothetical protein
MGAVGTTRIWTPPATLTVAVGGGVCLVAVTGWLLATGTRGAEIANILALPVAVVGLAATLFGLRLRPQATQPAILAAAMRGLAAEVAEREAVVLQQLLADTGAAAPADVEFAQAAAEWRRWRGDGGSQEGSLATVVDFYQGLERGRLVVLGAPGSGKTVLTIQLLLGLVRASTSGPDGLARVPLRLSLPAFARWAPTAQWPPNGQRWLDEWMTHHLIAVYRRPPATARALVAGGRILPILDGLDELDPEGGETLRARAVIAALNRPVGADLRPVVLTCRHDRYRDLVENAELAAPGAVEDCTVVVMRPLGVEQVVAWLRHRFPDPILPDGVQRRWTALIRQIRRHPTGALALRLRSPLRLYAAVTAYHTPTSAPRQLLGVPGDQLDGFLFERLIPAVVACHPPPDGSIRGG